MNSLDHVDYDLQQHEFYLDSLEDAYMIALPEKYDAIIEFAKELMNQEVDEDAFYDCFSSFWDDEGGRYNPNVLVPMQLWAEGHMDEDDLIVVQSITKVALEFAAKEITGEALDDLLYDGQWNFKQMVKEVIVDN